MMVRLWHTLHALGLALLSVSLMSGVVDGQINNSTNGNSPSLLFYPPSRASGKLATQMIKTATTNLNCANLASSQSCYQFAGMFVNQSIADVDSYVSSTLPFYTGSSSFLTYCSNLNASGPTINITLPSINKLDVESLLCYIPIVSSWSACGVSNNFVWSQTDCYFFSGEIWNAFNATLAASCGANNYSIISYSDFVTESCVYTSDVPVNGKQVLKTGVNGNAPTNPICNSVASSQYCSQFSGMFVNQSISNLDSFVSNSLPYYIGSVQLSCSNGTSFNTTFPSINKRDIESALCNQQIISSWSICGDSNNFVWSQSECYFIVGEAWNAYNITLTASCGANNFNLISYSDSINQTCAYTSDVPVNGKQVLRMGVNGTAPTNPTCISVASSQYCSQFSGMFVNQSISNLDSFVSNSLPYYIGNIQTSCSNGTSFNTTLSSINKADIENFLCYLPIISSWSTCGVSNNFVWSQTDCSFLLGKIWNAFNATLAASCGANNYSLESYSNFVIGNCAYTSDVPVNGKQVLRIGVNETTTIPGSTNGNSGATTGSSGTTGGSSGTTGGSSGTNSGGSTPTNTNCVNLASSKYCSQFAGMFVNKSISDVDTFVSLALPIYTGQLPFNYSCMNGTSVTITLPHNNLLDAQDVLCYSQITNDWQVCGALSNFVWSKTECNFVAEELLNAYYNSTTVISACGANNINEPPPIALSEICAFTSDVPVNGKQVLKTGVTITGSGTNGTNVHTSEAGQTFGSIIPLKIVTFSIATVATLLISL